VSFRYDPAEYPRAADFFVLPSVAEGMSNSLLEAIATALPWVVSGNGGDTDFIADGDNGRLASEPPARAWSSALLELLENPEEARHLGAAARERIDRGFALGGGGDRHVGLYRRTIAGTWP
jgi:L-malate glycosyltransferase